MLNKIHYDFKKILNLSQILQFQSILYCKIFFVSILIRINEYNFQDSFMYMIVCALVSKWFDATISIMRHIFSVGVLITQVSILSTISVIGAIIYLHFCTEK